jgi:precorrin-6A/cobalt-precorrin-6A reductase
MKILILGGTGEAKLLAKKLSGAGIDVTYSIAGLVRRPILDCKIIQGGFSQYHLESNSAKHISGLTQYLITANIDCLLDATHPFATAMSLQAVSSAQEVNIPYYSFVRPEWKPQAGDHWSLVDNEDQLLNELALSINAGSKNIFYTYGQIDQALAVQLDTIAELNETFGPARYIIRSAKETVLPQYSHWIQAIGPFHIDDEKALLEKYEIDLIVCKNSGGQATSAKLEGARERGIRVLMLQRPVISKNSLNSMHKVFNVLDECFECVREECSSDF